MQENIQKCSQYVLKNDLVFQIPAFNLYLPRVFFSLGNVLRIISKQDVKISFQFILTLIGNSKVLSYPT